MFLAEGVTMLKKIGMAIVILAIAGVALYVYMRPRDVSEIDSAKALGLKPEDFPQLDVDVFKEVDGGIELTKEEIMGRNTWLLWTAGSQVMLDMMASQSYGLIDIVKVLDSRKRGTRFEDAGLINEPGFRQATEADEYGLWIDQPDENGPKLVDEQIKEAGIKEFVYGKSTGILGLRLYPNPKFDAAAKKHWDADRFYNDSDYYTDPKLVRPYRVGMTCGLCHIAHHPINPPADPEAPKWENLASVIANQYIREGKVFATGLKPGDFLWEMMDQQPAGTSDTSRIATDHINNPNAINAIFNLNSRLAAAKSRKSEEMAPSAQLLPGDKSKIKPVPHVLKDGADSIGVPGATIRVYVNIGLFPEQWLKLHNPLIGVKPQQPFEIAKAQKNSVYWVATEQRVVNIAKFFMRIKPMSLRDAPGGADYIDDTKVERGKLVFAENCASCHSSNKPADGQSWIEFAQTEEFIKDNFWSDDGRHPVTDIGSNSARALGTNATRGHIWDNFSSETYKSLPSVGEISAYNPLEPDTPYKFTAPGGGLGYYRVPSLIAIWTSAPFLHNNSLGKYTGDPSVAGRMEAFDDAVEKLLWPEKRLGVDSIWRTSRETNIRVPSSAIPPITRAALKEHLDEGGYLNIGPIPKGIPINLLGNINLGLDSLSADHVKNTVSLVVKLKKTLLLTKGMGPEAAMELLKDELVPELLQASKCPDLIEDRGHEDADFGTELPDEDKFALIEFLKTL